MVAVLSNYRCGTIMDLPSVPRPDADLRTFTARCLRWYDNPTLGVYFTVDGFVYDMSSTYNTNQNTKRTYHCWLFHNSSPLDIPILTQNPLSQITLNRIPAVWIRSNNLLERMLLNRSTKHTQRTRSSRVRTIVYASAGWWTRSRPSKSKRTKLFWTLGFTTSVVSLLVPLFASFLVPPSCFFIGY